MSDSRHTIPPGFGIVSGRPRRTVVKTPAAEPAHKPIETGADRSEEPEGISPRLNEARWRGIVSGRPRRAAVEMPAAEPAHKPIETGADRGADPEELLPHLKEAMLRSIVSGRRRRLDNPTPAPTHEPSPEPPPEPSPESPPIPSDVMLTFDFASPPVDGPPAVRSVEPQSPPVPIDAMLTLDFERPRAAPTAQMHATAPDVARRAPPRAEAPLPDVLPSKEKLGEWEFPVRSFVEGDVPPDFPVDLMIDARHFFPREMALALDRRYGIRMPDRIELPYLEIARANASRIHLTREEHDALIDVVKKNLVAAKIMKMRKDGEDAAFGWPDEHLNRLELMVHLSRMFGEVGRPVDSRGLIEEALARAAVPQKGLGRLFRRPKDRPQLLMDDIIRFSLKAINADIAVWDALEVAFNASLGEHVEISVPATVAMSVTGGDGDNRLIDVEVPHPAAGGKTIAAARFAEDAFMEALANRKGNAGILYCVLAEMQLFYGEMQGGYYAGVYEEERRRMERIARSGGELFAAESATDLPRARRSRTERRSKGTLSGIEPAALMMPASLAAKNKQWVDPHRELTRIAYGIVASNLFSEAADTMIDDNLQAALTTYELARFSLQVAHARLKVAFNNPPEKGDVSTRDLIVPLNFVADRMMTNIKANVTGVMTMIGSPAPARPGIIGR